MATYSNLFIDQGSDFSFNVDLSGVDLDNYTARGQIRKSYSSTTATDFIIVINTNNDSLDISLLAADTSALKAGTYVYDVEVLSNDPTPIVTRVIEGQVFVNPRVTRGS
jgi:hypothetical protein